MILSNVSIHRALDKGWLKITPEPKPRFKTATDLKCPYQTTAVDLRLGNEISYLKKEPIPAVIDLRLGDFASLFGPHSVKHSLTHNQPYILDRVIS